MLERLYIKNVALIEEANIEFDGALNVLSGETGSGKSVILDSINFVLGSKADKSMIRFGEAEAYVRAEFTLSTDSSVNAILDDLDIESDGTVVISRKFNSDGRSSIKINGNAVSSAMLKRVAAHLVDVHGQSEHFFLLSESNQLSVIDCMRPTIKGLKDELAKLLKFKSDLYGRILKLGGSEQERARKLDLLDYQIKEIESADIKVGELDNLVAQKKIFDNSEKIMNALGAVDQILSADNGCIDMLNMAKRQIFTVSDIDREYSDLYERLENVSVDAEDVREKVSDLISDFNFDEREAAAVEERLTVIKNLIKKYGTDESSVIEFLQNAKSDFDALNDAAYELEKINSEIVKADEKICNVCLKITKERKSVCENFCKEVVTQLKSLNIPNANFYVDFNSYDAENLDATLNGADKICFMFSANKGEPAKPLSKVISGGEMSRFMLAVKTVLKDINGISTYIFDEIDAGISGITANSVAEKFISISKSTQIIAVSHLPQICAAASSQYLIFKSDDESGKTTTKIKCLNNDERVNEIVRLTGSIATEAAKVHAKELLNLYKNKT